MQLELIRDDEAKALLADSKFCEKWDALFQACPWATVFQSASFAKTWYKFYGDEYDPLFLLEKDEKGELAGLLALVEEKKTGNLHHVGTYHAEYQGWLAKPSNGNKFILSSLETLKEYSSQKQLSFIFLAPDIPLDWLSAKDELAKQSILQDHVRPMIDLSKTEKFTESLKKRGNKNKINRLKKLGDLKMEWVSGPDELENVFDEIEYFSKLRTSALHDVAPELDPKRKEFHKALIANNLIEVSLLKAGNRLASAQVIARNKKEKFLSTIAMSPFLAEASPGALHLMYLALEFSDKGVETFDLSPGQGYKERFANYCEKAYSLDIFFDKKDFIRHMVKKKLRQSGKLALEKLNIAKSGGYESIIRFSNKVSNVEYRALPQAIFRNIRKRVYESVELRVYAFDVENIPTLENPKIMQRNSLEDLLKYETAESWQFTRARFHQGVLERFEKGAHSYTYAEDGKLLHYGWLREREKESDAYDIGQKFKLPPDSSVLFDYFTHPDARGRGFYKSSLLQGLHDAANIPGTKKIFISVLADNVSSRRVIENIGFVYQGSLFKKNILGKVTKWQEWKEKLISTDDTLSTDGVLHETSFSTIRAPENSSHHTTVS